MELSINNHQNLMRNCGSGRRTRVPAVYAGGNWLFSINPGHNFENFRKSRITVRACIFLWVSFYVCFHSWQLLF